MLNISGRKEELILAADEMQRNCFGKRIRGLEQKYGEAECRRKIVGIFEGLAHQWGAFPDESVASLGVCYLYSNLLMRTYKFKIVLMGKEFWLGEKTAEAVWDLNAFFNGFEEDMEFILFRMKNIFSRLCKAEEEMVRFHCVDYYLAAISQLCRNLAEDILYSKAMLGLDKTEDFYFFFGRFQGEGEILWQMGENMAKGGI